MLTTWCRVLTRTTGVNALKSHLAYGTVIPVGHRGLATVTAPKKAASTVTKKTAATKSTTTAKAAPASTATSKKAAPKTAAATAKKPATAAKKTASTKEEDNAPKKRGKKTEEEKAKEKEREKIKSLLGRALDPPVIHPVNSPWITFLQQKYAALKNTGTPYALGKDTAQWAQEYKNLSPAQLEELKAQAEASKGTNQQALSEWIKQYTPAQIHDANLARASIRLIKERSEKTPRGLAGSFPPIPDHRFPTGRRTANILYIKERMASFPKEKKFEALPVLMKEFNALSEAEKQKWKDLADQDAIRYDNELRTIGIEPRKTE